VRIGVFLTPFSPAAPTMISPLSPLSDDELQVIDNFLLFEVTCDESMTAE